MAIPLLRHFTLGAGLLLCAVASAQRFGPQVGDTVEIYRHQLRSNQYSQGRQNLLGTITPGLSRDRLVRTTIIAENSRTYEIVVVQFSDAYNASGNQMGALFGKAERYDRGPYAFLSGSIFAVNDEGVSPRAGDDLVIYEMNLRPRAQNQTRGLLGNQMVDALRRDRQYRNSYFCEGFRPGSFFSVAIGEARYSRDLAQERVLDPVRGEWASPIKVQHYTILSVNRERR